jgi:hypothetical protein
MKSENGSLKITLMILSIITLLISGFSLFNQQVYAERMNRITLFELQGQDVVTTFISLFLVAFIPFTDLKKAKIRVVVIGCLAYLFYIYAYFSFGVITSIFYFLYIVITGLSFYCIIWMFTKIASDGQIITVSEKYPRKAISIFLFLSIAMVTGIEIRDIMVFTILQNNAINPFYVFYILDIGIVFPGIIISSILNLRRKAWGYLLSGISLIKVSTILPAVLFNDIFHWIATRYFIDLSFDVIALIITMIAVFFLIIYIRTTQDSRFSETIPKNNNLV